MSIRQGFLKTIGYMTAVVLCLIFGLSTVALKAEASEVGTVPATEATEATEENTKESESYEFSEEDMQLIPNGVYINDEHVGGMTIGEALVKLMEKEAEISLSVFTITYGEQVVEVPFTELGLKFQDTTEVLYDVATLGQTGTLISRYKELKDLENEQVKCTWSYSFDQTLLEEKAAAFAELVDVEPVDATIDRQNDEWFREPHVDGLKMDADATLELVRTAVKDWNGQSVTVEAVVNVESPKYTTELLDTITEIIGNYGTGMGGDVEQGRGKNVVRGAELIHGTILLPGESFSAHEKLAPFNAENGYDKAGEFINGAVVDNWGGGVCQLTTTLYNAVLQAELQVDRRYNHSLVITYAPHGFDSTVNDDGSKDLVFTNPYDFPIYIEAKAWSETEDLGLVYMAVWGTLTDEIREREVELYYKEIERVDPTPKYTIDTDLEPGEEVVIKPSYPKLVIEAYKKVTVNGEVISDELLYTDRYNRVDGAIRHNPIEETTGESEESSDVTGDTDGTDGTTEGTEATEGTSEGTEATEGTTEGTEATEGTAGETEATMGTTEGTDSTEGMPEATEGTEETKMTEATTEGATVTEEIVESTEITEEITEGTDVTQNTESANSESGSMDADENTLSAASENE